MENLSLERENCPDLPEAEVGEASGDELDILIRFTVIGRLRGGGGV